MAYTKYSLTPADNNAAPPNGAPEGMLPSAVNDTMRDMMAQIRDVGDGIRGGTYTMTAPVITGGSINNTPIGATTASTGRFSTLTNAALTSGRVTYAGTSGVLQDDADFTFNGTTVTMANDASISGLTVGKGGNSAAQSTAVGNQALLNQTGAGDFNTAIGYFAGKSITTGAQNTVIGRLTMWNSAGVTGNSNTAVGINTLGTLTSGSYNVVVGENSMRISTTATYNAALGYGTLYANTTGSNNVAVGSQALNDNTTGGTNTALGGSALYSNTTGSNNTAVGYQAGYSNTTGASNVYIGHLSGYTSNPSGSSFNVFVGANSGQFVTTGTVNTFIGPVSGQAVTTGSKNTIIGAYTGNQSGLDIRTASNYIVLSDGDGNPNLYIDNNKHTILAATVRTAGYTVATLPAGVTGMRAYVTDALAPSFGVTVAGSGAVTIPVFYNGANWIVG